MVSRAANWIMSASVVPRLLRTITIAGATWGVIQFADRFKIKLLPTDWAGVEVFVLVILVLILVTELVVVIQTRPLPSVSDNIETPEKIFAAGIIRYAQNLAKAGDRRDRTILQLYGWSSRLLHLMGAARERTELGQIALTAATALQDRLIQASILVDDLGWALYQTGDPDAALENIEEAIIIIDEQQQRNPQTSNQLFLELKAKALRHIANIRAQSLDLSAARPLFTAPRELAAKLPTSMAEFHMAQLDHSEAELILHYVEKRIGTTGHVDPTGELNKLLKDGIALADRAEEALENLGDHEREAKVLQLRVRLLAHDSRKQRYREAQAKLERLQREVARNLY